MIWCHINDDGCVEWTSPVEQEGLVALDLPLLEAGERARVVEGSLVVEGGDDGEDADAVIAALAAEIEEAESQAEANAQEGVQAAALQALSAGSESEALSDEEAGEETQAASGQAARAFILLSRLLDANTSLPKAIFHGRSYAEADEFAGDFSEWAFLNCEPTGEQKRFIRDYCRGRKFDALLLACPYHGQRVSFADVLIGTDKAMVRKDVLAELEAAGVAASGLEFRAALFKDYCVAHCGAYPNEDFALESGEQAEELASEALSLLRASESQQEVFSLRANAQEGQESEGEDDETEEALAAEAEAEEAQAEESGA